VHHWVKLLETTNDPDMSLFLIKETERLKCPTHGISEKDVIGSKAIVPLSPSKTFVENIQRRFAADRTITCSIHENGNTCGDPTLTTPLLFSAPPMLILDYEGNYGYPVQFIDLMIMGFEYELVAITRYLPDQSHFISYVKYENWYKYDGIGPRVQQVQIKNGLDLDGQRNLFFYAKK